MLSRAVSTLDRETEDLMAGTIDAVLEVHRTLGPGFLEATYKRALCMELSLRNVPHATEVLVDVRYKGQLVQRQRLDLVVGGRVVVEVKAVSELLPVHRAQVISYLRGTGMRVALLANFNVRLLREGGLRRIVV